MKIKTSTLLLIFIWCWFMGVTAISIGFGALFPAMNRVAKPFVCPNGKMDLTKEVYNPYPGSTITTITWYCLDEASGVKKELGIFPMSLYSGTIYGWLLFGIVLIGMWINAQRQPNISSAPLQRTFDNPVHPSYSSDLIVARMKELKDLRAANLISEIEYEEKRAEILKNL